MKISADLVDARQDRNLWGHSYQGDLRDVLSLESEVAQAIAGEIQVHLSAEESASLSRRQVVNPGAYETYLHALYLWNRRTPEDLRGALAEFNKAIEQDPTSALAWAGLADTYTLLVSASEMAAQARACLWRSRPRRKHSRWIIRWLRRTLRSALPSGPMNGTALAQRQNLRARLNSIPAMLLPANGTRSSWGIWAGF